MNVIIISKSRHLDVFKLAAPVERSSTFIDFLIDVYLKYIVVDPMRYILHDLCVED